MIAVDVKMKAVVPYIRNTAKKPTQAHRLEQVLAQHCNLSGQSLIWWLPYSMWDTCASSTLQSFRLVTHLMITLQWVGYLCELNTAISQASHSSDDYPTVCGILVWAQHCNLSGQSLLWWLPYSMWDTCVSSTLQSLRPVTHLMTTLQYVDIPVWELYYGLHNSFDDYPTICITLFWEVLYMVHNSWWLPYSMSPFSENYPTWGITHLMTTLQYVEPPFFENYPTWCITHLWWLPYIVCHPSLRTTLHGA